MDWLTGPSLCAVDLVVVTVDRGGAIDEGVDVQLLAPSSIEHSSAFKPRHHSERSYI
jgi:hypothetical protein